jgi:hypothetical protein
MKHLLAHHEEGEEKRITERLAKKTRKHNKDLEALTKSKAAANNIFANPSRVISVENNTNSITASLRMFI